MSAIPRLVGMIHLLPLPGSPLFRGSTQEVIETAVLEAGVLADAGFPALLVENLGDVPYPAEVSGPETVAAMTLAVQAVIQATGLPVGVNVLRNDALAALGIAMVTGSGFIRVNVLTGLMHTDQGPITGPAERLLRHRAALGAKVEIWADVMVKHASPPPGSDLSQMAEDTVNRGLADAVIVSGPGTGAEPDFHQLTVVRAAIPKQTRLVIGSGAHSRNLGRLIEIADTVIVGTSIKRNGVTTARVDPARTGAFMDAARDLGVA